MAPKKKEQWEKQLHFLEEPVLFKYITKRLPGNPSRMSPGFYAQYKGTSKGVFKTQLEAAKAASQMSGVAISQLRKPDSSSIGCPGT